MTRVRSGWLLVECAVLFGPALGIWLLGLFFLPVMLISLGGRPGGDWGLGLCLLIAGGWGVASVANLLRNVVQERPWPGTGLQYIGLALGTAATLIAAGRAAPGWLALVFAAPVLGMVHLLVLSRRKGAPGG